MFDQFYGFQPSPFGRDIKVDSLYRDSDRDEIGNRLKYAAKRQLFAVLTGESGAGKTTLLRSFNDAVSTSGCTTIYISDSKLTPRHFYKGILEQLGFEARYHCGDAKRQLHKEVELLKIVHNIYPVLIVDEAHLLARDMLEEIRFLLNLSMDSRSPMALILAGQSELRDKLRLQSYAAIRQRIDIQCHVNKLDLAATTAYIKAHLTFAGCEKDIFSDAAIDGIYKFSSGIPRLINKVAISSLLFGAQNKKNIIDDRMVKLVVDSELA